MAVEWPRARADVIDQEVRAIIALLVQGKASSQDIARMHELQDERMKGMMPNALRDRLQAR